MALVSLDLMVRRDGGVAVPEQIVRAVRAAVADGRVRPDDRLPSTRALAAGLGVARGTVVAAYEQLVAEGYLVAAPRSGMRVHPDVSAGGRIDPRPMPEPPTPVRTARAPTAIDLVPGHESFAPVADADWRRALRRAGDLPVDGPPDPAGSPVLRAAIAEHLRLARAMTPDPAAVLVTAGARDGLSLVLGAVRSRTGRSPVVAVETPGFPGLRRALDRHAVEQVGFAPADAVPDRRADLVLLTPNHQFPYGTPLPAAARQRLLHQAAPQDRLVVEDDYDSEFRHLGPALPSLWSLDPQRVVHIGTFAAVLGRDVAGGYLLAPDHLRDGLLALRRDLGTPVAPVLQRAIADYLDGGGLRRRIARGRRRLARSGRVVTDLVARHGLTGQVVDTGHLLVLEGAPERADRVRAAAQRRGVLVGSLADGWAGAGGRSGLMASYGGRSTEEVARGVDVLLREWCRAAP